MSTSSDVALTDICSRAQVGRNLASMELLVFIATLTYRYELRAKDSKQEALRTSEGFLVGPLRSRRRPVGTLK